LTTCNKLSYKLKFNYVDKTQRFFGLKRVQLHASIHDPTMMRERLSYSLFREMGIAAPRQTHVNVMLNSPGLQRSMGVHILTEVLDGRFTEAFFKGGDGNLYKEAWPGTKSNTYVEALRTNEEEKDVSQFVAFSKALSRASDDYELVNVTRQFLAAKHWATYWAVDNAINNWDGPVNFRREDRGYWNHNFFIYETDTGKRQLKIVPWDLDSTWGIADDMRDALGDRPEWDAPVCEPESTSNECITCRDFSSTFGMSTQMAPSCFKMVRVFARGLRSEYMNASLRLLTGPLHPCRVMAKLERWSKAIAPFMDRDEADGNYPATSYQDAERSFSSYLDEFKTLTVPGLMKAFRSSVSCSRAYDATAWSTHIEPRDIVPMLKINEFETGAWEAGWMTNHLRWFVPFMFCFCMICGCCVVPICCCYCLCCRKKKNPPLGPVGGAALSGGDPTMMAVTVPPGSSGGSTMIIATPAGQQMQVTVPAGVKEGEVFNCQIPKALPSPAVVGATAEASYPTVLQAPTSPK